MQIIEKNHPLNRKYSFWISLKTSNQGEINYESAIHFVGNCDSIEDFWGLYQHFVRPDQLGEGSQIYLFQSGIKPVWEDIQNQNGGRFIFRVKKFYSNKVWEDLLLSYIGDQFQANNYINGMICNPKKNFISLSIWVKDFENNQEIKQQIQDWILQILQQSNGREVEYISHPKINEKWDSQPTQK